MARFSTEERLARILAMVPWVVAQHGPTVDEVCARFACEPRDLAADIDLLYLCGVYPYTPDLLIEATIRDGRVWIDFADFFSAPFQLTPIEALTLMAAAGTLLEAPGTDPDGPLARGLAKLATAIGGSADTVDVELAPASDDVLGVLRDAIAAAEQVRIDYYAFARDRRTERLIEPAGLFADGGHWYVAAWCHAARDERTFRVDRIAAAIRTGEPRRHAPVDPAPGLFRHRPAGGDIVLDLAPEGRWVLDQYPVEERHDLPGGHVRVRLAVTDGAWLDRLVLRLGPAATVVSAPPGWPGVAEAAVRILERYGAPPPGGPAPAGGLAGAGPPQGPAPSDR